MRRIFIIVLCMSLLFGGIQVRGEEKAVQLPIIEETEKSILTALNISFDGSNSNSITRAEMAKLICNILKLSQSDVSNISFNDLKDVKEAGYIKTVSNLKYMIGYNDNTFRPKDEIAFEQISGIATRILGYAPNAIQKGGYPDGYLLVASSLGILKGIDMSNRKAVTIADAYKLAYNILNASYKEQITFGENSTFVYGKENTILSKVHKITKHQGIIVATERTFIDNSKGCNKGELIIEVKGYRYAVKYLGSTEDIIGRKATVFINTENDEDTIVAIMLSDLEEQQLILDLDEITIEKASRKEIEYRNNDVIKKIKLNELADYIYNGVCDIDYSPSNLLELKNAKLTLVDNNFDNYYDLVFVDEYINYLVDEVDLSKKIVYDKYNLIPLDFSNASTEYLSILKNNIEVELQSITEWNVLSVYKSKDLKIIKVIVSEEKIMGEIKEEYYDDEKKIVIADKTHKIAFGGIADIANEIKVGAWGKFYFDYYGKLAGVDLKSNIPKYAILTAVSEDGGILSDVNLKLLTSINKFKVYKLAEKFYFNGSREIDSEVLNSSQFQNTTGTFKPQLITYKINENDEIIELNTVNRDPNLENDEMISPSAENISGRYRYLSNAFASQYVIGPKTVIFGVPLTLSTGIFEDKEIVALSPNYFTDSTIYSNISVYDLDEYKVAGVILYGLTTSNSELSRSIAYITKVSNVVNERGEVVNKIYYIQNGASSEGYTSSNLLGQIQAGQGIRIANETNGDIAEVAEVLPNTNVVLRPDTVNAGDSNLGSGADMVTGVGIVEAINKDGMIIENSEYIYRFNNTIFLQHYDVKTKKFFTPIISSQIRPGMKVFFLKRNDVVREVILTE